MGISGLNTFIVEFHVSERISMPEEIEKWKVQNNGQVPTILIDLKEAAQIFMRYGTGEMNVALGGCFTYYRNRMIEFMKNFGETNAKMVFFMAGRKYTDDLEFFIQARESAYIQSLDVLDKIEGYSDYKELEDAFRKKFQNFHCDFRMVSTFEYNLERLVRRHGDFHVNYVKHNQVIARYANEHADEVLAIITNDTDFMAFEGDFQFWKANDTNVTDMTCYRYCRRTLCDDLGLDFHQMKLLGALCGTKYLSTHLVSDFLNGLASTNDDPIKIGKIWNVSAYIKQQPYEVVNNKPKFDLEHISKDVFGSKYTPEQLNSIANSLKIYDLDLVDDPEPNDSFLKKHNTFLYKLSTGDTFCVIDIEYIDFRNYTSKSYAELIMPILMKMCGILFKDNIPRPEVRKICMKHAHDEPFKVTEEEIVYPPMELPELFDLIFKRREKHSDALHWSLLEWILDLNGDFMEKLRANNHSNKLSAVIITLKYFIQHGELSTYEANAILITEYKIHRCGSSKFELHNVPNIHYIRIAHLYVKMYVVISHCLGICGLRDMTNLIRFDGPVFLKTMEEFETTYDQQKQQLNAIGLDFFTN
ncbi:uncharacterized protein LOC129577628 [Sitodiplosis mosellana]|uniref:uncharacterized protein LOC129577628 n=1 Tax=Sitodiplosis mosellana TaxID=263140 RepID=UPI0024450560|nr:uncharacterized protein LOC129577628 [Sitodiplosis mosellana]